MNTAIKIIANINVFILMFQPLEVVWLKEIIIIPSHRILMELADGISERFNR